MSTKLLSLLRAILLLRMPFALRLCLLLRAEITFGGVSLPLTVEVQVREYCRVSREDDVLHVAPAIFLNTLLGLLALLI